MHHSAFAFVRGVVASHADPHHLQGRVLEVGSRIFHNQAAEVGDLRALFQGAKSYTGIDCFAGPGVDVVGLAHDLLATPREFEVVLCTEVLEHDPRWRDTVRAALSSLSFDGLAIFTWATPKRAPHEVETASPDGKHYAGVELDDFRAVADSLLWEMHTELGAGGEDGYCWGVR